MQLAYLQDEEQQQKKQKKKNEKIIEYDIQFYSIYSLSFTPYMNRNFQQDSICFHREWHLSNIVSLEMVIVIV